MLYTLLANPTLIIALLTWLITELIKQIVGRTEGRKWFDPGGMPSGHAAVMAAAAMTIGLTDGFQSALFALSVVLWGIIISDAHRVRWSVGEQAVRLNELAKRTKLKPLPVVRGHRPSELAVGSLLGVALALTFYFCFYA
ncbi:hypothetical protein EXS54_02530 [Patescibacteria group bacterium]|nr:hypothetical protein [Patescibacteria group bacterium]